MCDASLRCPVCGTTQDRQSGEHWVLLDGGKRVCTHPWHNPNSLEHRGKGINSAPWRKSLRGWMGARNQFDLGDD